jgi:hypothetical protein
MKPTTRYEISYHESGVYEVFAYRANVNASAIVESLGQFATYDAAQSAIEARQNARFQAYRKRVHPSRFDRR